MSPPLELVYIWFDSWVRTRISKGSVDLSSDAGDGALVGLISVYLLIGCPCDASVMAQPKALGYYNAYRAKIFLL